MKGVVMDCKYIKPLLDSSLISAYEAEKGFLFPQSYRDFILENNGGSPVAEQFDTEKARGRVVKSFLSFNRDDRETIWKVSEWNSTEIGDSLIPIAMDPAGNLICFVKADSSIVFLDLESLSTEMIAESFQTFIKSLY